MTAHTSTFVPSAVTLPGGAAKHLQLIRRAWAIAGVMLVALVVYGGDYYGMNQFDRPFSPKHTLLKPSGAIGINLGFVGTLVVAAIFFYPLRKRWAWLRRQGNSKHWLDYHVALGFAAPVFIAFHASFKFRGLAGVAFWVMVVVALSGLVGRYIYGKIPQRIKADELSLMILGEMLSRTTTKLRAGESISQADMQPLLQVPSPEQVAHWPLVVVLGYFVTSDLARPFVMARLRLRAIGATEAVRCLGGLLPSKHARLEWMLGLARQQAELSRRIVFLSRAQQAFRLWHVIHRPFSYAFAVLALTHIVVAMLLGFV
jgi:hypothetical protein